MAGQRNKDGTEGAPGDDASSAPEQASRRKLMGAGASLAIGGMLPAGFAGAAAAPADAPKPSALAPAEVLKRLREGNARYAANTPNERDFSAERAARATAQYPIAAILSCADSRVVPDLVFDQEPGDLFVVRVAGNIVTTDLLASIEYGVQFLGAVLIVVMGHSSCGAVDAAIKVMKKDAKLPGHLPDLIRSIKPAVVLAEKHPSGTLLDNAILENVKRQVAALKRATPIIASDYAAKKIDIVGGVYDIATGKVTLI